MRDGIPADSVRSNRVMRSLACEFVARFGILQLADTLCDPDFVNQTITTLVTTHQDIMLSYASIMRMIKSTGNVEDLQILYDKIKGRIQELEQRMSSDEQRGVVAEPAKQHYLNRMRLAKRQCERRIRELGQGSTIGEKIVGQPLARLTLDHILGNVTAMIYFMEFMEGEHELMYVDFWHNVDRYRLGARNHREQLENLYGSELLEPAAEATRAEAYRLEQMRLQHEADAIYETYLSETADPRIALSERMCQDIRAKIDKGPDENAFNAAQTRVYHMLETKFYPRFLLSESYLRCLAEMEAQGESAGGHPSPRPGPTAAAAACGAALPDTTTAGASNGDDDSCSYVSMRSDDGFELPRGRRDAADVAIAGAALESALAPTSSAVPGAAAAGAGGVLQPAAGADEARAVPHQTLSATVPEAMARTGANAGDTASASDATDSADEDAGALPMEHTMWSTNVRSVRIQNDEKDRKTVALYVIEVTRLDRYGMLRWKTLRRYSDFHDFHMQLCAKWPSVAALLRLPPKRAFGNLDPTLLEQRRQQLDKYLTTLVAGKERLQVRALDDAINAFLSHNVYEKEHTPMERHLDTIMSPLKASMRAIRSTIAAPPNADPGTAAHTTTAAAATAAPDAAGGASSSASSAPPSAPATATTAALAAATPDWKVEAGLADDEENTIPFRIMLAVLDEVFDLRYRNQWLRQRVVALLKQIIRATFGASINRRIIEYVDWLTSAKQMASYVSMMLDWWWPNGMLAPPAQPRTAEQKLYTKLDAKSKLLESITDDLRRIVGAENCRAGGTRIFDMFQVRRCPARDSFRRHAASERPLRPHRARARARAARQAQQVPLLHGHGDSTD